MSAIQQLIASIGKSTPPQKSYTTVGTFNWICPAGVTSVSVVCVGAGGAGAGSLRYKNNIAVTPGASYTVEVGTNLFDCFFIDPYTCLATGGDSATGYSNVGDGGGNGHANVGGGAGGYSGNGGVPGRWGQYEPGNDGAGGAGGGGASSYDSESSTATIWPGGGVGLLGQGSNGVGGATNSAGGGGSGGADGGQSTFIGGDYGGSGGYPGASVQDGGRGAVRIIWPGDVRYFPSTRTADE